MLRVGPRRHGPDHLPAGRLIGLTIRAHRASTRGAGSPPARTARCLALCGSGNLMGPGCPGSPGAPESVTVFVTLWRSRCLRARTPNPRPGSSAASGAETITGVPAAGLPNKTNFVSGIVSPTRAASPLWSITAKSFRPFAAIVLSSRSTVSATDQGLCLAVITMSARVLLRPQSPQ